MDSEFEIWQAQWDAARADREKNPPRALPPQTNPYFDFDATDAHQEPAGGGDEWVGAYNNQLQHEEGLLSEASDDDEEGFGPLVRGNKQMTKGDITYFTNPQPFYAMGPDAAPYDKPVRVTPGLTNDRLSELDEARRMLEVLERRVHRADVLENKSKRDKLKKELAALRKKVHKLSDGLQSQPDKDVT